MDTVTLQYLELKKNGLPVVPKIELERSAIGPKAKQDMGKLLKIFAETDPELIINELKNNNSYTFQIGDNSVVLDKEDFIVDFEVNEKYQFAKRQNLIVIISLERDNEMMEKGLIKDKTEDIAFLVRVKNVDFTESCKNYKDEDIDGLKIKIAVE